MQLGIQIAILLVLGAFAVVFVVSQQGRRPSGDRGDGRRGGPRSGLIVVVLTGLAVGLVVRIGDSREAGSVARTASDTASSLVQESGGSGFPMAIAIAVGALALAVGIVMLVRSQNRQY